MKHPIEPLEARIAPASAFTFTDPDGDLVTITTSRGAPDALAAAGILTFSNAADVPRQLQKIDLSLNPEFAGTDLTITAKRVGPGGDGVTAVGFIDASSAGGGTALDLGKVTIDGDLGRILAGTASAGTAAKAIDVRSWGLLGTATQAGGGDLISQFTGRVGSVLVRTDFVDARYTADGTGALKIGGDLLHGRMSLGAQKTASIFIGGNMVGSTGLESGSINAGEVGSFVLRGSLIGGSGTASGRFFPGKVGSITIGGDLIAGSDIDSGRIENNGAPVGTLIVRGSLLAAAGAFGATINVGDVGSLLVGGSLVREGTSGASLNFGNVKTLSIGGSLRGGDIDALNVGSLSILGSMIGGASDGSGSVNLATTGRIFIGGDLLAGSGPNSATLAAATTTSSSVTVRGSLIATNLSGASSASLLVADVGSIFVGGDLLGGSTDSADISAVNAKSIFVGGIVRGGAGVHSAQVEAGEVGKLRTGSIFGGAANEAGAISVSRIGSLLVAGDILGGTAGNALAGGIFVDGDVAAVEIRGNVVGGSADIVTAVPTNTVGGQVEILGSVKTFKLTGDLRGGPGDNTGIVAIGGDAGAVTVGGRIVGNSFAAASIGGGRFAVLGKTGSFTLGGDLVGDGTDSGKIISSLGFGSLRIGGDIIGGQGDRSGVVDGDNGTAAFGTFFLGGSLRGGEGVDSGAVEFENKGKGGASVFIRGSVIGGGGDNSGQLDCNDAFAKCTIEGSVLGGSGPGSGVVDFDNENTIGFTSLLIKGDIRGGSAAQAGRVLLDTSDPNTIGSVVVGGSIVGGTAEDAGNLDLEGDTKLVIVNGSIVGGVGDDAGSITIDDSVGTVLLRGDLRGGVVDNAGRIAGDDFKTLTVSGSILGGNSNGVTVEADSIGTFTVGGSLRGADGFLLRIESRADPGAPLPHVAFGKINVGGSVLRTLIHAGFHSFDGLFDSDAQVGAVTVGGDWIASSLAVGARNLGTDDAVGGAGQAADNIDFADGHDAFTASPGDDPAVFSTIASIAIGGRIQGTTSPATDHFGFIAQEIKAFKLAGETLTLATGRSNDNLLVAATGDLRVREG